jgi:acyl-CoA oxidase
VQYFLYTKTIKNLGTEKHKEYLQRAAELSDFGAFGMTELGHGSNVQSVETIANYDAESKGFILNSPSDTSIKFWIGNLGKTCSMLVTFAQLYVNDTNHGVHVFLVPVRDKATHETFEGCLIGD